MPRLEGAFSTVVMTNDSVVAFRDGAGLRPLALGQVGDRYCVASESCAFDIIGARFLRDVQPGEMVSLSERGIETRQIVAGRAALVLRVRAHLLRAPRLAARGQPHAGLAPQDGRDPVARGAGGRGRRDRRAGLRQPGGGRLREGIGHHARRRPDQEPLRRAHVHPARPGAAQARPADEVQPAARGGARQAHRGGGRLDRARQHHAPDREDAARRGRRPRCTCASRRRRSATRATTGSTCRPRRRWSPTAARSRRSRASSAATRSAYLSLEGVYEAIRSTRETHCDACFTGEYPLERTDAANGKFALEEKTPCGYNP